ncbi:ABC transporter permease [Micromonospora ureilytica]|uniref:ABC transport system permease protein n=1 Tax=Micromonospora ureilytica TaxID=709868 RepID=A0ABS0JJW6_9ACTN|nr:ABC transporter permease [Micromonospora ureilytica]MBG6067362.1 putative ABC transport system permease protein [Micromonospora ureilytica]WSR59167.1 ABC transporter permease [Micromonospora ureilytica]
MSMSPSRLAPTDVLRLGLLGVTTRRMRAVLSALGISIGIATLVVVVGIPASSQRDLMDQLSALGTNLLRAEPVPDQDPPALLPEDAAAMVTRIGPVDTASAVANTHTAVRRNDLLDRYDTSGLSVLASRPDLLGTVNGRIRSGRALDAGTARLPTAVLGHVAASRLGYATVDPRQPPQVFIGERWFTVIGILDPLPLSPDLDRSVLVGWDAAKAMLGFDGHPTVVYLRAREDALEDVRAVLPATLNPQLPGLVQVSRPSDALAAKRATENSFSALFLGLAAVALLVGGIGVANTMVISVLERRREIGLRRALGANRGQIRVQFLTESVLLSVLGGAAGAALGVLATVGYATYQGWPPTIPLTAVLGGITGALLVGVVAGVYPSIRAARLTPTEALNTP